MENKKNNAEPRKFILAIIMIIFIAALVVLAYRLGNTIMEKYEEFNKKVEEEKEEIKKSQENILKKAQEQEKEYEEEAEKIKQEQEKQSFNSNFETWIGTKYKSTVSLIIDRGVKNNTKNSEHKVEFVFDGTSYGTDPENIKQIKNNLKNFKESPQTGFYEYEVSAYYDDNGYINKITIQTR